MSVSRVEMISSLIIILMTIGGVLYSAVSMKKDIEIINKTQVSFLKKINNQEKNQQNILLELENLKHNKNLISNLENKIDSINSTLLKSVTETSNYLLKIKTVENNKKRR